MTLAIAALREQLAASAGSVFRLTAEELGIPAAETLFHDHLDGATLTLSACEPFPSELAVVGELRLRHLAMAVTVLVSFLADDNEEFVAGIRIDAELPDWTVPPEHLDIDPAVLRTFGFTALHLLLDATPAADGAVLPRVGLGASRSFPGAGADDEALAYVTGFDPPYEDSAWCLSGEFEPVPLRGLDDLASLIPGLEPGRFSLPPEFGSGQLAIGGLSVTFAPGDGGRPGRLLSAWIRVELDATWSVFPGYFEISDPAAEFAVTLAPGGFAVQALISGFFTVAEQVELSAEVVLPQCRVIAQLVDPVPLTPVLERWFPGAGLPADALSVRDLRFETTAGDGAPAFGMDLALAGTWRPVEPVVTTDLALSLLIGGPTGWQGSLEAIWELGDGKVLLRAAYEGGNWTFGGIASHLTARELFAAFDAEPPSLLEDLELLSLTVGFDGNGRRFELGGALAFPMGTADAVLTLDTQLNRRESGSGYDRSITGVLDITLPDSEADAEEAYARRTLTGEQDPGPRVLRFAVDYQEDGSGATVTGTWSAQPGIGLTDLASALGVELPDLPEILRPELTALTLRYHSGSGRLLLTAVTEHTGWVFATAAGQPGMAVAARVALDARASQLPLVGEAIPAGSDLVLDALTFTSAPSGWTPERAAALNSELDQADPNEPQRLPRFATGTAAVPGMAVQVGLTVAGERLDPLVLPLTTGGSGTVVTGAAPPPARTAASPDGGAVRELGLVFGPVRLGRIRLGSAQGRIFVALDAELTVGPVRLILLGLGLGIDGELRVAPVLRGAGVELNKPPLRLGGLLERRTGSDVAPGITEQYNGLVALETGFFALTAAGSYAKAEAGWSSMFLFGEISGGDKGLFGPPQFRVIAISLGFGVNSTVRPPSIAEVGEFPLVQRLAGTETGTTPEEVLERLAGPGGWVTPREGQYWGAGGVEASWSSCGPVRCCWSRAARPGRCC
nr:DUF6603 domain-containing protein [Streptomyces orinoci]